MSRRIKRTTSPGDRPKNARAQRDFRKSERPAGHRSGGKPARLGELRQDKYKQDKYKQDKHQQNKPRRLVDEPAKAETKAEVPLPTRVQTVVVTPDEDNMRVDRFLEARFPGLSFSHIQRIVRKGELRVNGKRADSKDRLEAGQSVRIPPLRLDTPKASTALSEAESQDACSSSRR